MLKKERENDKCFWLDRYLRISKKKKMWRGTYIEALWIHAFTQNLDMLCGMIVVFTQLHFTIFFAHSFYTIVNIDLQQDNTTRDGMMIVFRQRNKIL